MLGVFQVGLGLIDLGIDVAVRHQNVEPAVVVHVEEADAPAEQPRVDAQAAGISAVLEVAVAEVGVERVGVAGEVGLHHVEVAVAVVVADGNAHAGLRLGLGRERRAGFDRDVAEGSVFLVLIERGGRGIVGDIDIGPAVVVQIGGGDAQAIGADRGPHAGLSR